MTKDITAHGQTEATEEKIAYYEAPQRTLMWRRFSKHKMAFWSLHIVGLLYFLCLNCGFFAPCDPATIHRRWVNLPPQRLHFGRVSDLKLPRVYVHPYTVTKDPVTLLRQYRVNTSQRIPLTLFPRGRTWKCLWLFETDRHFFGCRDGQPVFLLGTGTLGQDVLSRLLYGGRISMLLGLTGVALTFILGISLGGISGFYGGKIDMVIQRFAEMLQSVPKIPIWLALAAAIPKHWTSLQVYFGMTLILACMGWTGLCRTVRGKLLSLREEDYARAAIIAGATERRVIFVHLIPNFFSHIIASLTLAIPGMILAETSLSFLGLGLQPPMVSWGVLLQDVRSPGAVINQPWLLTPALTVIVAVLALNFVGEGLRDAADPYST